MVSPAVQHEQMWVVHLAKSFLLSFTKSKNIILLSLKFSEIAQLIFQLPLVPSTRPHVKYPSSLLLKYYNLEQETRKMPFSPVSGKYFF